MRKNILSLLTYISKRFYLLMLFTLPFYVTAQQKGILFEKGLSWKQIKEKASRERKYIFVDCYATWCGPCKLMEQNILSLDEVGKAFNPKFLSVRMQMDQTPKDDEYVKSCYPIVDSLKKVASINAYPCFLFFSSNGELVHRGVGYRDANAFINLGNEAVDPNRQYLALRKKYISGRMKKQSDILSFIYTARNNGDGKYSNEIAAKYKKDFLDKLSEEDLCTKDNLTLVHVYRQLVASSQDNFFNLFYNYPEKCDSLDKGLAESVVAYVINKEEINDKIWNDHVLINTQPDWDSFSESITKKYSKKYAEKLIMPAKEEFLIKTENWSEYAQIVDERIDRMIMGHSQDFQEQSWTLNGIAWMMYKKCNDKRALARAVVWSELSIIWGRTSTRNSTFEFLDTLARLLYKLGRVDEAIEKEEQAIVTEIRMAGTSEKSKLVFFDEFNEVLKRMKNGESLSSMN